jgi:hypothetical protein
VELGNVGVYDLCRVDTQIISRHRLELRGFMRGLAWFGVVWRWWRVLEIEVLVRFIESIFWKAILKGRYPEGDRKG